MELSELPEELPEGTKVLAGSAMDLLPRLIEDAGPTLSANALVGVMGAHALEHSLNSDCGCGAERHLDQVFEVLDEIVEEAKANLRPEYLHTFESMSFAREAHDGLDEIDVIPEEEIAEARRSWIEDN